MPLPKPKNEKIPPLVACGLGGLYLLGGVAGYVRRGSRPSLLAGVALGGVVGGGGLLARWAQLPPPPPPPGPAWLRDEGEEQKRRTLQALRARADIWGLPAALAGCAAATSVMGGRYLSLPPPRPFFPAGFVAALSAAGCAYFLSQM
jgi:uncharacterized membrane protein (UPF0136 family)